MEKGEDSGVVTVPEWEMDRTRNDTGPIDRALFPGDLRRQELEWISSQIT